MLGKLIGGLTEGADSVLAVARSGLLAPERPDRIARMAAEVHRRGPLAAACTAGAIRFGERPALIDEHGSLSFREIDERSNALARAWIATGIRSGDCVAILCRNHRGFVEALFTAAKVGLRIVLLNTEFAAPQIADVCERERVSVLVYDAEFDERVPRLRHLFGAGPGPAPRAHASLEGLPGPESHEPVDPPFRKPEVILLTSGTTGSPRGAPRGGGGSFGSGVSLLARIPFRTGEATYVAPPLFHALGIANLLIAFGFGSTVVTRPRFDPEQVLELIERHRCTALVAVPVMLQRIVALDPERLATRDLTSLQIVLSAGAQLPGATATRLLDLFGDVLYVLYGSTEVAYVTVSTPADHRQAPASVGRPVSGVTVRLLDERGEQVPEGETGRIFVANGLEFGGYTDGRTKETIGGLMSTGDIGHFDEAGRLYIDGRDDEMIVSGGENVYPQEVEELLNSHPAIADAAVVGVEDADFGQRLAAFVVAAEGADPDPEQLRDHIRENLARYKVPREIRIVGELPRNATGKILKRELRERAAAGPG